MSELEALAREGDREAVQELVCRGAHEAVRRLVNRKGPFRCSCGARGFEDIDAYMEHCRLLHRHGC